MMISTHKKFVPLQSLPTAVLLLGWVPFLLLGTARAQSAIYRCGTEYTNNPTPEQRQTCKALDGGNITVIPTPRPAARAGASAGGASAVPPSTQPRVDPATQKARDSDARAILEAELRRAEQQVNDLRRQYNGGQPERLGEEVRNQQKYGERVAALKASLARAESDLAGIQRELSRVGGTSPVAAHPSPVSR